MWKSFASIGRLPAATRQSCFHLVPVAVVACVIELKVTWLPALHGCAAPVITYYPLRLSFFLYGIYVG